MVTVPKDLRLRACLLCSLIKSFDEFEHDGCDNCEEYLRMKNNKDNIFNCTTSDFDGMISVMTQDAHRRVCKMLETDRLSKGVYAMSVSGELPASVIRDMKSRGYTDTG